MSPQTLVKVAEIITHPQYKTSPVPTNDFALLRLGQCQDFNKGVAPACLPADNSRDFAGTVATVTGWGKLRSGVTARGSCRRSTWTS